MWILASAIIKATYKGRIQAEVKAAQATETAEAESLKRQVVEARMAAMQAQVEPHFLFNTLASIDHLIETDPKRASQMQKNLIALLRASMPTMREANDGGVRDLARELQVIRPYLEILKVRMEERLATRIDVPDGLLSAEFPPMMVQTLVENAIKHGLEPKAEGGQLTVKAEIVHGKLQVSVADTGLGFGRAGHGRHRRGPGQHPRAAAAAVRPEGRPDGGREPRRWYGGDHHRALPQPGSRCRLTTGTRGHHDERHPPPTRPRAVLADDERLMREQLRARLLEVWPELDIVAEAKNGLEAVALVEQHRPDIVFLDIRMPGLTGVDAARQIAQLPAPRRARRRGTLPEIVFITAYDQYAVEAFEQGVVDYVLKPAERDRLQLTAERLRRRLEARRRGDAAPDAGAAAAAAAAPAVGAPEPGTGAAVPEVDPGQRRAARSR
jgi:CheY-like chemotaxis protein